MKISDLPDLLGAGCSIISIDCFSVEEHNIIEQIVELAERTKYPVYYWTFGGNMLEVKLGEGGLIFKSTPTKPTGFTPAQEVCSILDEIEQYDPKTEDSKCIFILGDVHKLITDSAQDLPVTRRLKSLALTLEQVGKKRVILLGPGIQLPQTFSGLVEEIKTELPNQDEVRSHRDYTINYLQEAQNFPISLTDEEDEAFVRSLQGFTVQEIGKYIRLGIRKFKMLDFRMIEFLQERKIAKLEKLGVKFSPPPDVEIAGLTELQDWIKAQSKLFTKAARRYEIAPPKGILLVGVPGTGKSLAAKTIGWQWKMPILSLNIGNVLSGIVGSSERNLRDILDIAETVSPCILFLDEIEKGLSGVGAGSLDSGVSDRIFGTLLTWMNDKTAPVFVVAAANNIQGLPPELLRKGRFDETWFVGLPYPDELVAILMNHCKKLNLSMDASTAQAIASKLDGYSGAEIGAIVAEVQKIVFARLSEEQLEAEELVQLIPKLDDFLAIAKKTKPLSQSRKDDISKMIEWGKKNARMASIDPNEKYEKPIRATGARQLNKNVPIEYN